MSNYELKPSGSRSSLQSSGKRFRQPVVAADGFTYENDELAAWVLHNGRISKITGEPISAVILPNRVR